MLIGDYGKAEDELGWEPQHELRGARGAHGRRGPQAARRAKNGAVCRVTSGRTG